MGDHERFLDAGMSSYLSKPIRKSDILAALVDIKIVGSKIQNVPEDVNSCNLPLVENSEFEKLAQELGADILPVVLRQFIAEVELRCPMANKAFLQFDLEGVRKATHALSGICATVGAQRLRRQAEAIETGYGEMEQAVLASHLRRLNEVANNTIAAFNSL